MLGARLQLVLRVANDREGRPVVQRLVTAFASRRIQRHRHLPNFAERLQLADELVSLHAGIVGRKRP